jgi:hypothetical protein
VFLVVLGLAVIVGFVVTHRAAVPGNPRAVPPAPTQVAPLTRQPGWTTLSNPESGLSYQIPPSGWRTNPQNGTVAQVTLTQGAERTGYTCGKPLERLIRGVLGSGAAPRTDPAALAEVVAQAAAGQYYATGDRQPQVTVEPARPVLRHTGSGTAVRGALARAIAHQHADRCLASAGEVLVLVLQFPDHDGVLLVNADVAGGPAQPAPATDRELRTIIGTAHPTD